MACLNGGGCWIVLCLAIFSDLVLSLVHSGEFRSSVSGAERRSLKGHQPIKEGRWGCRQVAVSSMISWGGPNPWKRLGGLALAENAEVFTETATAISSVSHTGAENDETTSLVHPQFDSKDFVPAEKNSEADLLTNAFFLNSTVSLFEVLDTVMNHCLDLNVDRGRQPLRKTECAQDEGDPYGHLFSSLLASLADDPKTPSTGAKSMAGCSSPASKRGRGHSWKLRIGYRGSAYCGWEAQSNNPQPSVQERLAHILQPILYPDLPPPSTEKSHKRHSRQPKRTNKDDDKDENTPQTAKQRSPVTLKVCGRTDTGVNALGQVCRIRSFDTTADVLQRGINSSPDAQAGNLRCFCVEPVSDKFHPTFGASHRAYAYLIDLHDDGKDDDSDDKLQQEHGETLRNVSPRLCSRHVPILDALLRRLEGVERDYIALSYGRVKTETTLCTLHRARASIVELVSPRENAARKAVCMEIVGNRFLRRMIRILVATAIRETFVASATLDNRPDRQSLDGGAMGLLNVVESLDRSRGAQRAPADGLLFVNAEFFPEDEY